ncbi:hypothetical protein LCGC14_2494180 [marine sediment metagenome]|uniref:Uncharacterized protein n=1 Tax=marine sediment metagenome TaxID=412755 RepID=A0A0F9BRS8_9ZZZZ
MPERKRKTIRRIQPWERLPMYHAEEVGGDKEVALLETPGGDFKIQTREHEYELDLPPPPPPPWKYGSNQRGKEGLDAQA